MKKNKKIKIIVIVFLILFILVGAAFAWYTVTVLGNENAKTTSLKGAKLEIQYVDGPQITALSIIPGDTITKTFSITNSGNTLAAYKVAWETLENNYVNKADFVYSIQSTNGGGTLNQTQLPNSGNHVLIANNIAIAPGVTQSYTVIMQYLRTENDQIADKGRTLTGIIEVTDLEEPTTTPQISNGGRDSNSLYGHTMLSLMKILYPIGSIYTSTNSTNPGDIMGGEWAAITDTFLLAAGDTYPADDGTHTTATAGSANAVVVSHSHTINLQHRHSLGNLFSNNSGSANAYLKQASRTLKVRYTSYAGSTATSTTTVGSAAAGKNMPPYLTVYMWKRIE